MVLHDLHDISAFWYHRSKLFLVVERECSKPAENQQTLITNRLQETLVLAQTHKITKKIDLFESIPIDLDQWSFCYLTSSLHHPASLYREGSICEEEILRYFFRTEAQPRSHRLADLWPFSSKSNTHSFYRSRFKYGERSWNTQHFHSYCSSKNVLFMGQNDLDPRTNDLNLNVILAIEILYQYEYVAQVERLNYGTITAWLRKSSAFRCKIK